MRAMATARGTADALLLAEPQTDGSRVYNLILLDRILGQERVRFETETQEAADALLAALADVSMIFAWQD